MGDHVDKGMFAAEAADLHHRLTRLCLALTGDRGLAEECAQEALVRAWERVDRGEPLESLAAWTTTVALNQCRSRLRRRSNERRSLDRLAARPPVPAPAGDVLSDDVRDAVLALPRRQREVVVLHYLLDEDTRSIASVCGITEGAVRNALFNARAALALRLSAHLPGGLADRQEATTPTGGLVAAPEPPPELDRSVPDA